MDPQGLAETIKTLLLDDGQLSRMRSAMAEMNYGNQAEISKYMELFG
jgi:hypothetical protein